MTLTDVLNCISSIIALFVSIIAIIISVNTAKKQTKLDLFDKRYNYYIACDVICACCIIESPEMFVDRPKLLLPEFSDYDFGATKFLFDEENCELMYKIYSKGMYYRELHDTLNGSVNNIEKNTFNEFLAQKKALEKFFPRARKELTIRMKKYLDLNN